MKSYSRSLATGAIAFALAIPQPVYAQTIDFGDDASEWANDGECDDPRFSGDGMTSTTLLDEDILHDATDCRTAFEQGRLTLGAGTKTPNTRIIWGDDEGDFANDGECDDMRFEGAGMTATILLESDVKHDASDCRVAFEQGRLKLVGTDVETD